MQPARFLITGGSQGIGAAIVELARKAGHQVVFTGRNEQLIEATARKTGAHGIRAVCVCPSEGQTDFGGRTGRNNPNKLYAVDIGDTIMAALNMPRRALWPELAVFANNPWKED